MEISDVIGLPGIIPRCKFTRSNEKIAVYDRFVGNGEKTHLQVWWDFFRFTTTSTFVIVIRNKVINECWIVKVWTKTVMTFWVDSRCWLNNSTTSHTKILMTIVDRSSFVNARIDALHVFSCTFWIGGTRKTIETWASRVTCVNSRYFWRLSKPWAGFKTQSRSETESE